MTPTTSRKTSLCTLSFFVLLFAAASVKAQTYTLEERFCYDFIQGKVAWSPGGSTTWEETNVRKLCKGTKNPYATVACFKTKISSGLVWNQAIDACTPEALATPSTTTTSASPNPEVPSNYELCAKEGGRCQFIGSRTLKYGANGQWVEKIAYGSINCNNTAFGRDPAPFVAKNCYVVTPPVRNVSTFNMIFASDPQFPFCESAACKSGPKDSNTANEWHSTAIGRLAATNPNYYGVVINGDLTNTMRWEQIDVFEKYYASKFVIYPGLGNHDYMNYTAASNDTIWGVYDGNATSPHGTFLNLLQYFAKNVRANKNIDSFDWNDSPYWDKSGSLAYFWDIGDYRFIQLNNFPAFSFKFSNYASRKVGNENFDIQSSLSWLRSVLSNSKSKKVVLNMHCINTEDCQGKWTNDGKSYSQTRWLVGALEFERLLGENQNVVAIFAGHSHALVGDQIFHEGRMIHFNNAICEGGTKCFVGHDTYSRRDASNKVVGTVPVLFSGSAEYNIMLSVKFEPNKIIAQPYRTVNGNPTAIGTVRTIDVN